MCNLSFRFALCTKDHEKKSVILHIDLRCHKNGGKSALLSIQLKLHPELQSERLFPSVHFLSTPGFPLSNENRFLHSRQAK